MHAQQITITGNEKLFPGNSGEIYKVSNGFISKLENNNNSWVNFYHVGDKNPVIFELGEFIYIEDNTSCVIVDKKTGGISDTMVPISSNIEGSVVLQVQSDCTYLADLDGFIYFISEEGRVDKLARLPVKPVCDVFRIYMNQDHKLVYQTAGEKFIFDQTNEWWGLLNYDEFERWLEFPNDEPEPFEIKWMFSVERENKEIRLYEDYVRLVSLDNEVTVEEEIKIPDYTQVVVSGEVVYFIRTTP